MIMKLQEYINEFKGQYHATHGVLIGLTQSQSEVYVDLTVQSAMQYLQKLMMSGKLKEVQSLVTNSPESLLSSSFYQELIDTCVNSYYGLEWDAERKKALAVNILGFVIAGLKQKFEEGGHSPNAQGVMQFLGLDQGLLGKMGSLFGKWF
ncbi:MAG: hypothetical protein RLZZ252_813 [Bacteroidota bacterium]|jgi:hypothetical protein